MDGAPLEQAKRVVAALIESLSETTASRSSSSRCEPRYSVTTIRAEAS